MTLGEFKNQVYGEDYFNVSKQNIKQMPMNTLEYPSSDYLPRKPKARARSARRGKAQLSTKSMEVGAQVTGEITLLT